MLSVVLVALAQLPVASQPDPVEMKTTVEAAREKRPRDSKALLAIKQGPIDASLAGDLAAVDWLIAGAWSLPSRSWSPGYEDAAVSQFHFVLDDGRVAFFSFDVDGSAPAKSQVHHTNFDAAPVTKAALVVKGKTTYLELESSGAKELHRVVQYRDGVLVLDLSADGKPGSKRIDYRQVRVAMPRRFESRGQ